MTSSDQTDPHGFAAWIEYKYSPGACLTLEQWLADGKPRVGTSPWDELLVRARVALIEAEKILGDEEAAKVAKETARMLAGDDRLRDGHVRAIKAHAKAIAENLGEGAAVEYLDEVYALISTP